MSATKIQIGAIAPNTQTRSEELANVLTHVLGLVLSLFGLPVLVAPALAAGNSAAVAGTAIFGGALVLLYTCSALYHAMGPSRLKRIFRRLDHMSIYVLIAGTYSLVALTLLEGWVVWGILIAQWSVAAFGMTFKAIYGPRWENLSTGLYLVMGWMALFFIIPILEQVPTGALGLLLLGGLFYTGGVGFYLKDQVWRYAHSIWHLFVMAGSAAHFAMGYFYALPG